MHYAQGTSGAGESRGDAGRPRLRDPRAPPRGPGGRRRGGHRGERRARRGDERGRAPLVDRRPRAGRAALPSLRDRRGREHERSVRIAVRVHGRGSARVGDRPRRPAGRLRGARHRVLEARDASLPQRSGLRLLAGPELQHVRRAHGATVRHPRHAPGHGLRSRLPRHLRRVQDQRRDRVSGRVADRRREDRGLPRGSRCTC